MSCLGGKCNNVTNPMPVATNNPMRNTQRRPTGIRRQAANNATTTYNPLRRPANSKNLTDSEIEEEIAKIKKIQAEATKIQAEAEKNLAEAKKISNKHGADLDGITKSMSDNTAEAIAEAEAEWEEPSAGQTQAERKAELAEIKRKQQEANTWPNRQPQKVAVFNTRDQHDINEAKRDLPAGWYADYDKNGRIVYYYQPTPRSAVTKEQYERPT